MSKSYCPHCARKAPEMVCRYARKLREAEQVIDDLRDLLAETECERGQVQTEARALKEDVRLLAEQNRALRADAWCWRELKRAAADERRAA